jgi:predicted PurR-regulated permease PerM
VEPVRAEPVRAKVEPVRSKAEPVRAKDDPRYALVINDPQPLESAGDVWASAAEMATVGIFVLFLVVCLYLARPILLPILTALLIGTTFGPVVKHARGYGISPWITAIVLVLSMIAAAGLAVTLLAGPAGEWISRAPDIGASIKQKLYVFDRPLAALTELQATLMPPPAGPAVAVEPSKIALVQPVVEFVTPALAQIVVFFATLLFVLAGQMEFRRYTASLFASREAKLRFLRIANDIEGNLASYVAVVTAINLALGLLVGLGAVAFGFSNPIIFGVAAMFLNYIPYIGPACMAIMLLAVGLVTFPTLGYALLPPAAFVALTTLEGHFVTPTILGQRLTLNPLAVFLALAFWTWLWGAMGAFLAVPLLIVALVIFDHLFPSDDIKLPG